jgi:ACS family D-galactonate transporter-like MFS transporter
MALSQSSVRPLSPATGVVGAGVNQQRWSIVALLTLGVIVAYVDRVNLSVAVIDTEFKSVFQLTARDRGLVTSAFFWSYAALQIPAGWLVDRYGSKRPYAVGYFVWSLLSAGTALATGFSGLFAARLLLGVGEAVMHPASMRWIRFNFAEKERGLAIGVFMAGSKYGPAIGTMLSAWLIQSYGWRAMFLAMGLGGLLWLVPWIVFVKNDAATGERNSGPVDAVPFGDLLARRALWGTIIGTFCYMYFVYFSLTWLPSYLNEARHLSLASSSLYTTFSFAGMATVGILGGWSADRLIKRGHDAVTVRRAFTIAGFLMASTELVGANTSSLSVALFFSIFSLSGLGLATANYWALTQTLMPGAAVGRIVGIQNTAASLPGIVAPILTGWLVQRTGTYRSAMWLVFFLLLVGVASYAFLVRRAGASEGVSA